MCGSKLKISNTARQSIAGFVALFFWSLTTLGQVETYPLSYSARLTNSSGGPLEGAVDVQLRFWSDATGGDQLAETFSYTKVILTQGVLQLRVPTTTTQIDRIFGDGSERVFVEITADDRTYPRQEFTYIPLALRVPIDNKTLTFASGGRLAVDVPSRPSSNSFLSVDSKGKFSWETPAVTALRGQSIASAPPASGQVLSYDGTQWVPKSLSQLGATTSDASTITSGTLAVAVGGTGLSVTPANGQIPIGNGSDYSLATLSAGTGISISNAAGSVTISATDDAATKVSKNGDTMTGALTLPADGLVAGAGQFVLAGGNVGIGTTAPIAALEVTGAIKLPYGSNLIMHSDTNPTGTSNSDGFRIRSDDNYFAGSQDALIIEKTDFNNATPDGGIVIANAGASGSSVAALTIRGSGLVGVGTVNPTSMLHVSSGSTTSTTIQLENSSVGGRAFEIGPSGSANTTIGVGKLSFFDKTAGAPRMVIDSTGNLGVGTTSPEYKLDVAGMIRSTNGIMFPDGSIMTSALPTPTSGYNSRTDLNLAADSGGNGTGVLVLSTKSVERMRVTNSGNVGIGTTAPGATLDLAAGTLAIRALSGSASNNTAIQIGRASADATLGVAAVAAQYSTNSAAGDVTLRTEATGQRLLFTNGASAATMALSYGNVGIGTTQPTSKLQVIGDGVIIGNLGVGTSLPTQALEVAGTIKSNSGGFMFPDGTVMTTAASGSVSEATSTTDLNLASDTGSQGTGAILLATRGAERMRVTNIGNVGVGTNAPVDKLSVWSSKDSSVTAQFPGLAVGDSSLANAGVGGGISLWGNYTGTTPIAGASIHAMKNVATAGDTGFNLAFNTRTNAGSLAERMRISSTGSVGIGTVSPIAPLDFGKVLGNKILLYSSTTTNSYGFGIQSSLLQVFAGTSADIAFGTGSSSPFAELVRIKSSGKVGIGTSAPANKLSVTGDADFSGNVGVGTTTPTAKLEVSGQIKSSTGGIMFPDGSVMTSAVAPSVGSSSITDLNLGADIGATGSGVMTLSTSGAERMRVNNDGKIGIGTSTPANTLDVAGSVAIGSGYAGGTVAGPANGLIVQGNVGIGTTSPSNLLSFGNAVTNPTLALFENFGGANLYGIRVNTSGYRTGIYSNGSEVISITPANGSGVSNIGIGTTSPQRVLDIKSGASGTLTEQLVLRNGGTTTTANTGAGLYFALTNASTSRHAAIDAIVGNAVTGATDLTLSTYNGTAVTEKMRIQAGGSVGIGTTAPFNMLSVAGGADFTGNVGIGSSAPTEALDVAGVIRSSVGGIMFPDGSIMTSAASPGTGTSSTGDLTFAADSGNTGTGVVSFSTRGSERMRVSNTGNIGFGTASPLSKVDVNGGMAIGTYAGTAAAATGNVIVSGSVGIGTSTATGAKLSVMGGNVGIGTMNPPANLSVLGKIATISSGGAVWDHVALWADSNNGFLDVGNANPLRIRINSGGADGPNTATYSDVMTFLSNGNIGIGSLTPTQRLEVAGLIKSSSGGFMFPDGTVMTTAAGGTSSGSSSEGDLTLAAGTGVGGAMLLSTQNTERMRIDYSGNVGIGTTAPKNKLDVAGSVAIGSGYAGGTTGSSNGLIVQGNVGIGTISPFSKLTVTDEATIVGRGISVSQHTTDAAAALMNFRKSRGTAAAPITVASGDYTADFTAQNYDGTSWLINGNFGYRVTGTPSTGNVPGQWVFAASSANDNNPGVNNTIRMVVGSDGNVGIGTTIPSQRLVSVGDSATYALMLDNSSSDGSSNKWRIGSTGPAWVAGDNKLVFTYEDSNSGNAKLTIDAAGNVGIGTTSPVQKLDVAGAIRSTSGGFIFPDGTSMTTAITASTAGSSSNEDLNFAADYDASGAGAIVVSTNGQERMRVLNGGNIGIGTSVPKSTLDVAGGVSLGAYGGVNAAPTNGLIVSGNVGIGVTSPLGGLHVNNGSQWSSFNYGANIVVGGSRNNSIALLDSVNSNPWAITNAAGSIRFSQMPALGNTTTSPTQRVVFDASGNVGIGTPSPITKLHSVSNGNTGVASAFLYGDYFGATLGVNTTSSNYYALNVVNSINTAGSGGNSLLYVRADGSVGIGTTTPSYTLHVNGSVAGVGSYNALSDIRYKKDVQDLAGSLAKILAIRGVSYKWLDEDKYGSATQLGVIAQEIEKIVPEVVTTDADGVKRVKYDDLIPLIIEAMKAMQMANNAKDAEIKELKAEAALLKAETAHLKAAICYKFPDMSFCGQ